MNSISNIRWLIPMGALLTLLGYFGPWVDHKAAALVVTGLDLGEYVKFLVPVQNGTIRLWREGFYLPLVAVSLTLSLFAFRHESRYGWPIRIFFVIFAWIASLNMLPPAWSPDRLVTPEFRLQTGGIILCLGASLISPLLALLPYRLALAVVALLSLGAVLLPVRNFWRILSTLGELYHHPIVPGLGVYVMVVGLLVMVCGGWLLGRLSKEYLSNG